MANVLILSLVFPPDGVSTAQIMGELAIDLARKGHDVAVVTTQPHYNRDEVLEAAQPLMSIWGGLLYRSSHRGVPVLHTRIGRRGVRFADRAGGWLMFHVLGLMAILRYFRKTQVIIVPSPLLSAGALASLIGVITGARYIYNVQELYPDLAINIGKLRNPIAIAAVRALERYVYRTAAAITVITRSMAKTVVGRGVAAEKVYYIPNFVDVEDLSPLDRTNAFSRENGLIDRFVVSYAGNMGHAQGLGVVLDAAEKLKQRPDIVLLMIGDGAAREALMERARARDLSNVVFLPHHPYVRVREIYSASDVSIVAQLDTIAGDAIPSKTYRIMACACPVLAITGDGSELASVVAEADGGVVVPPDAGAVRDAVLHFAEQSAAERARTGAAGRDYVRRHVARTAVTAQYDALVRAIEPAR